MYIQFKVTFLVDTEAETKARPPNNLSNDLFPSSAEGSHKTNLNAEVLCDSDVYEFEGLDQVF